MKLARSNVCVCDFMLRVTVQVSVGSGGATEEGACTVHWRLPTASICAKLLCHAAAGDQLVCTACGGALCGTVSWLARGWG